MQSLHWLEDGANEQLGLRVFCLSDILCTTVCACVSAVYEHDFKIKATDSIVEKVICMRHSLDERLVVMT